MLIQVSDSNASPSLYDLWRISQHWFRWWFEAEQAPSHYLNQQSPSLLMHIRVIQSRSQTLSESTKSLFTDAYTRHSASFTGIILTNGVLIYWRVYASLSQALTVSQTWMAGRLPVEATRTATSAGSGYSCCHAYVMPPGKSVRK